MPPPAKKMTMPMYWPDLDEYVVIDRFFVRPTGTNESYMVYKVHRIDQPDCSQDNDNRSKAIPEPLYEYFWARQRHDANPLQHSLPERHMLKLFTAITNNKVHIVDCHRTGHKASTQFYVTIRLNILPFVLENILTEQINAKPSNAKIVKLCDDLLGATFKADTGLVSLDESDEDVGSRSSSAEIRSTRSPSNSLASDENAVAQQPAVSDAKLTDVMYGRIQQPVSIPERNLFRLAAIVLQCTNKSNLSRIRRSTILQIYDKSGADDGKTDKERIERKKPSFELTIVCDYATYTKEMQKWMSKWKTEMFNACMKKGVVAVDIVNDTYDLVPPMNAEHPITKRFRRYIEEVEHADNIRLVDEKVRKGCDCAGTCDIRTCRCRQTSTKNYECNSSCKCSHAACTNRTVTTCARVVRLQIRRTIEMGWTVVTLDDLPKGQLISVYVAQLKHDNAKIDVLDDERVGPLGHTQLFDVPGKKYVLDSYEAGNCMTFIQHSCKPNCEVRQVWTESRDPKCPHLIFYASENIPRNTPLSFNYLDKRNPTDLTIGQHSNEKHYPLEKCRCGAEECCGTFQRKQNYKPFRRFEE